MLCLKCQNALCFLDYWHLGSLQLFIVLCSPRIIIVPYMQNWQSEEVCLLLRLARKGDAATEFSLTGCLNLTTNRHAIGCLNPKDAVVLCSRMQGQVTNQNCKNMPPLHWGFSMQGVAASPVIFWMTHSPSSSSVPWCWTLLHSHKPGLDNTFRWLLLRDEWSHLPWGIALSNTWRYHLH